MIDLKNYVDVLVFIWNFLRGSYACSFVSMHTTNLEKGNQVDRICTLGLFESKTERCLPSSSWQVCIDPYQCHTFLLNLTFFSCANLIFFPFYLLINFSSVDDLQFDIWCLTVLVSNIIVLRVISFYVWLALWYFILKVSSFAESVHVWYN